jgi:hypothetical protein
MLRQHHLSPTCTPNQIEMVASMLLSLLHHMVIYILIMGATATVDVDIEVIVDVEVIVDEVVEGHFRFVPSELLSPLLFPLHPSYLAYQPCHCAWLWPSLPALGGAFIWQRGRRPPSSDTDPQ